MTERHPHACVIESLAQVDAVTDSEVTAVIEWCQEWARDCEQGDLFTVNVTNLLNVAHRLIDGGLAFVLGDVRRVAREDLNAHCTSTDPTDHQGDTCPVHESGEFATEAELPTWTPNEETDPLDPVAVPFTVEHLASGTEDGHLWYVVEHGDGGERRIVSSDGWMHREHAEREARDLAKLAKLTDGQRAAVTELRSHCPAPGDFGAAWLQGDQANEYRYLDPVSRDAYDENHVAEFVATFVADIAGETDSVIVTVEGNVLTPTMGQVKRAAVAAKLAAESFTIDMDSEDAESAAQRAVDILRDLSADDVPAFLTRVFGLPAEQRYAEKEMRARSPRGVPEQNDSETIETWRMLREQARAERGYSDVARVLVFEYRDIIAPIVFAGHEGTTECRIHGDVTPCDSCPQCGNAIHVRELGDSTNLSMWREALHAFEAISAVRAHTFGGCCLVDFAGQLDRMDDAATGALIESVQWAAFGATTWQDGRDSFEVGMPRAE